MGLIGGDFQHLLPLHQTIAAQQNQERIEWIRHDRWINHTKAEQVLARLLIYSAIPHGVECHHC